MCKISALNRPTHPVIYTIGHSTHPLTEFIGMLKSFNIELLADIRRFPGSKKYPQFNQGNLAKALKEAGIDYVHLEDLGGRRKMQKDSINSRWRNESFRGYADYMQTSAFKNAIESLEDIAETRTTALMCSEAVWWRCHRSMVADELKAKGWTVLHIMAKGKSKEHPYTSPAIVIGDQVFYTEDKRTLLSKKDENKI